MTYRPGDPILAFRITSLPLRLLYAAVLVVVRAIGHMVFGLRIVGREELDRAPRAVLVSNHTLIMDPAVVAHALYPRRTCFTMLEQTALAPYLGTFVRLLGAIPLPRRGNVRAELEQAVRAGVEAVGYVHFFPEGECYHRSQEIRPFRRGAFLMAIRAGLPVIPVTTVLHRRVGIERFVRAILGREVSLPPRATVVIGEAVRPPASKAPARDRAEDMCRAVQQVMQETIDRAGGCKTLFRGQLPRLVGPERRASRAA